LSIKTLVCRWLAVLSRSILMLTEPPKSPCIRFLHLPRETTPTMNPLVLSDVGTYQDSLGNNIVPYYFPFTGTPADNTGTQELYYITVDSAGGVRQFVRVAWPPNASQDVNPDELIGFDNFIPNGQFLSHNDIVSATEPPVSVSDGKDFQAIAQGGWSFARSTGGSSVFTNSFTRITTGIAGLNDFPRYAFNFQCTTFNTNDQIRDLQISWYDVNKFSSGDPIGSQDYTFFFAAESRDANTYTFDIRLIQNYGTGGTPSATTDTSVGTVQISPGYSYYSINIPAFPDTTGKTLGTNNDDYVALSLRGPSSTWNIQATDFVLVQGNVALTSFPVESNADMLTRSVAGWMPTPAADGNDLYLPLVLTPSGMTFDHSIVGTIVGKLTNVAENNELLCDGSSYDADGYSAIGIPYSRLFSKLFSGVTNGTLFGGGVNYVNVYESTGLTNQLIFATNKGTAPQTAPADGAVPTGFTFGLAANPSPVGSLAYRAFSNSIGLVTATSLYTAASALAPSAGTSGMTVIDFVYFGTTGTFKVIQIQALTAAALAAGGVNPGLYFLYSSAGTNYYFWFQIGTEADPAVGGRTGIKCKLTATMSAEDVGAVIAAVMSSEQIDAITVTGVPPAGSYFLFQANSTTYTPWYQVAGLPATAPAVTNPIKVILDGTETSTQVAGKTQSAVNSEFFAVPDLRGMFLRGNDASGIVDIDFGNRWSYYAETAGASVGTFQASQLISHFHNIPASTGAASAPPASVVSSTTVPGTPAGTNLNGGTENRPINMTVNWFIKY